MEYEYILRGDGSGEGESDGQYEPVYPLFSWCVYVCVCLSAVSSPSFCVFRLWCAELSTVWRTHAALCFCRVLRCRVPRKNVTVIPTHLLCALFVSLVLQQRTSASGMIWPHCLCSVYVPNPSPVFPVWLHACGAVDTNTHCRAGERHCTCGVTGQD